MLARRGADSYYAGTVSAAVTGITVRPVRSAGDLRWFIRFPWTVYRGIDAWVPPLISDVRKKLDTERNPFYEHAEIELFLACRDGVIAGTVAAIIDLHYNNFHDERTGFFGFFEAVNDDAVAGALIAAAVKWLRERGMKRLRGPVNPSTAESMGILLDSYDRPPAIMMAYNPPYYPRLLESAGLTKTKDLVALHMAESETPLPPKVARVAERVSTRHNVVIRSANLKQMGREMALVKRIYNDAWTRNWGFVPFTDAEIDYAAADLKMVLDPDLAFFAFVDGEPAGFSLAVPDFNQVLRRMNGRLFPVGVFKVLWYRRRIDQIRVVLAGVRHQYRNLGLDAVFYYETYTRGAAKGFIQGEFSWVLEDNVAMLTTLEKMGARVYKRYRMYDLPL